ncbi:MAG: hypothetical protein HKP58_11415 [Desulfatitalea sp.]|nr:hypothetical protein [Desulfatitalea sp.]NNK01011.1 hypothetical protein [Desulfatitalea sp.]
MQNAPLAGTVQLIVTDAITFYVRHFTQIATLCLPFLILTATLQYVLARAYPENYAALVMHFIVDLFTYPIYTAVLIRLMSRRAQQEDPGNMELIMAALPQWGSLLMLRVFKAILIVMGLSMFILPGIWIMVRLCFAEFYLVLFNMRPREALEKSTLATAGHFWLILAVLAVTYAPILMLLLLINQHVLASASIGVIKIAIISGAYLLELFLTVALFRTFMEITIERQREA